MKKLILFVLLLSFIPLSNAETLVYDNLSTSQYKTLSINDNINIKYINEYSYKVYINDSYLGEYRKDELIFVNDGSNITIFVDSPISTNFDSSYDVGKVYLTLGIMYFIGFGVLIILAIIIIKKFLNR